jgi:hypothetical protein
MVNPIQSLYEGEAAELACGLGARCSCSRNGPATQTEKRYE